MLWTMKVLEYRCAMNTLRFSIIFHNDAFFYLLTGVGSSWSWCSETAGEDHGRCFISMYTFLYQN